ncbi:MAG: SPFH domain-containing protein [Aeromicrobium sp.]
MPFTFILTILLLIATPLSAIAFAGSKHDDPTKTGHNVSKLIAGLGFGFALLMLIFSVLTVVPTRDIGIVTSFGKPVGTLSNGIHLKAPWHKVKTLDGAIQTDSKTGTHATSTNEGCIDIRIGNDSTACVDNSVRWRIKLSAGDILYKDYREMNNIRDSLVTRELKAALNEVLSDYNPLADISALKTDVKPDLNKFATDVTTALQERVGDQVDILSVIIPIIRFDRQTQSKINLYQAEVANTRIAEQREETAKAQAQANRNLADSVSKDPNVLVSICLDTLNEMVKEKQPVPIGFSCWPGNNSTVVLPKS